MLDSHWDQNGIDESIFKVGFCSKCLNVSEDSKHNEMTDKLVDVQCILTTLLDLSKIVFMNYITEASLYILLQTKTLPVSVPCFL